MHLVPADRADHRSIDGHRACQAIGALGDPENIAIWAQRFSLLADPGRLLRIDAAAPVVLPAPSERVASPAVRTMPRRSATSCARRRAATASATSERRGRSGGLPFALTAPGLP